MRKLIKSQTTFSSGKSITLEVIWVLSSQTNAIWTQYLTSLYLQTWRVGGEWTVDRESSRLSNGFALTLSMRSFVTLSMRSSRILPWNIVHEILPDIALFLSMRSLVILQTKIKGLMRHTRLPWVGEAISQLILVFAMLYETFLRRRKTVRYSLDCMYIIQNVWAWMSLESLRVILWTALHCFALHRQVRSVVTPPSTKPCA